MSPQKPRRACVRSLAWVRERVGYSAESICNIFQIAPERRVGFLTMLQNQHIIRRRNTPGAAEADVDEVFENYLSQSEFAFCYVGMYSYNDCMVYILPKYVDTQKLAIPEFEGNGSISSPERRELFTQVLKAIRCYHSRRLESEQHAEQENPISNDLALLVTIVSDFAEHGEYRDEHQVEQVNGPGRHMWAHTINKKLALIQHDSPIYPDIITRQRTREHNNQITLLHRRIVSECYSSLAQFGLTELLDLPANSVEVSPAEENDSSDYLLYLVESELSRQFDTRRRHILNLLKAYLSCQSSRQMDSEPEFAFGCSSFHMLWEDACRTVLGDDISGQLQIKSPVWSMKQQVHEAPSSLIPDMIFSTEHGTWIMDAKYYLPLPGRAGNLPLGLPGTSDITKQFLYQQALQRPEAHHNSGRSIRQPVHNAFLLPAPLSAPADHVQHYATVSMPLFPQLKIEVLQVAPHTLFACYTGQTSPALLRSQLTRLLA